MILDNDVFIHQSTETSFEKSVDQVEYLTFLCFSLFDEDTKAKVLIDEYVFPCLQKTLKKG